MNFSYRNILKQIQHKFLQSLITSGILCLFFINALAFGNDSTVDTATSSPSQVVFAGVHIVTLSAHAGAFSAQERAVAVNKRLSILSNDRLFDVAKVSIKDHELSTDVVAEDMVIVSIMNLDALELKTERSEMAKKVVASIKNAIEADRKEKSPKGLILSSTYAAASTIVFFLLLYLLNLIFPKLKVFAIQREKILISGLHIRSLELLSADRVTSFILWLLRMSRLFITLLIVYFYILLVLSFFPWSANLAPKLIHLIIDPIQKMTHVIVDYIPNLFFVLVISITTRYLLRFVQLFFSEIDRGTLQFEGFYQDWAMPTYKLVRFLILAFSLVIIFPYLPGSGSPAFQGVSVFLGILFSLGSSSAISNIVGGIVLTYMRPFKIGDRVKIADTVGDIVEKTLLITRIRTIKNVEITIPNSMVLGSHIINYSSSAQSKGLILHTTVTIGYDVPWKIVHELLNSAAAKTPDIQLEPAPFILQTSLDDFYVSYELNAYTNRPNQMALTYSSLHQNIQDAFNKAEVEIMSPHYTSLRDGNAVTIHSKIQDPAYAAPAFRVETVKLDPQ